MESKQSTDAPRYFVAIPLPDDARERLIALQPAPAPGMRLISREELHLTLHFLGELPPGKDIAVIHQALAALKGIEFSITMQGVGRFPPAGPAQVLWAGVRASPDLLGLHQSVGAALADAIGYKPETRPFSPHVTLARVSLVDSAECIDTYLEKHKDFGIQPVVVEKFALYSSMFVDGVPHYVQEATFRLLRQ